MGRKKLPSSFAFGYDCDIAVFLCEEGTTLTSKPSQPRLVEKKDGKNHMFLVMS